MSGCLSLGTSKNESERASRDNETNPLKMMNILLDNALFGCIEKVEKSWWMWWISLLKGKWIFIKGKLVGIFSIL